MFDKHRSIKPYIVRQDEAEINNPEGEFYQLPEELEAYLQFTYCIKCGCCMAACPTLATDVRYLGPMPLAAGAALQRRHARRRAARAQSGDGKRARRLPLPLCGRVLAGYARRAWIRPKPSST